MKTAERKRQFQYARTRIAQARDKLTAAHEHYANSHDVSGWDDLMTISREIDCLIESAAILRARIDTDEGHTRKHYTVIGFYEDNDQPFMAHVQAANPTAAAARAKKHTDAPGDLCIVEVIKGRHRGVLGNNEILRPTGE